MELRGSCARVSVTVAAPKPQTLTRTRSRTGRPAHGKASASPRCAGHRANSNANRVAVSALGTEGPRRRALIPHVDAPPRRSSVVTAASTAPQVSSHIKSGMSMPTLAYEIVTGSQVTWTPNSSRREQPPPTAVLIHGIMGSKRNLQSLAAKLVKMFPKWQVVMVDLRNHGGSANLPWPSPSSVDASASDVLRLLSSLKVFPRMLIGHSFGGKVVLAMSEQFCRGKSELPRPVQVWVLDALPGDVRSEESPDHPQRLIDSLQEIPMPLARRQNLLDFLDGRGFSQPVAQWVATNLRPTPHNRSLSQWTFDLQGIAEMYESYEKSTYWEIIKQRPTGLDIDFVRAEKSTFRWAGTEQEVIEGFNCGVYTLLHAGHWVHHDNLDGLMDILKDSLVMHDTWSTMAQVSMEER